MNNPFPGQKRRPITIAIFVALVIVALVFPITAAHAIKLTMKRVVFEGSKRTELLTLINDSDEQQTYRIAWRNMTMRDGKILTALADGETIPGLSPADHLVIFAPRRITIPAGGSQQLRVMLRKPADLADGEYRSHLWIRPEEDATKFAAPNTDAAASDDSATGIQIKMLVGINFPIIVRQGKTDATATITNPTLTRNGDHFTVGMDINRVGNRSLYGDIRFTCQSGSTPHIIHEIHGIAVYAETATRHLDVSVPVPAHDSSACQSMHISYLGAESPSKKTAESAAAIIAETTATLQ